MKDSVRVEKGISVAESEIGKQLYQMAVFYIVGTGIWHYINISEKKENNKGQNRSV